MCASGEHFIETSRKKNSNLKVHGIVHDTIEFVKGIIRVEMNSATDNPLVFADREEIISGGNFHGEYPAKVSPKWSFS
jgi:histidine ammonia-lyase